MSQVIKDFPTGPLDRYRKNASFDWKKMKVFIETENIIQFKAALVQQLKNNPIFHPSLNPVSFEENRKNTVRKMQAFREIPEMDPLNLLDDLRKPFALAEVMMQSDSCSMVKYSLNKGMFVTAVHALGTSKHLDIAQKFADGMAVGCFCLTEIGHGSNTKAMQTRAKYDLKSRGFIIHSPNFQAAKCWTGLLGQTATHVILYAQLYTADGTCHGLHQFVVQIRDTTSLRSLPGIIVGDMGEKVGLNGVDNGFLVFQNYYVSRDALLNKNADVTEDGKYITSLKDPAKRFGASLGALSEGRVNITGISSAYLSKGITIAIRYSAVRRQFGPDNEEEIPVLEYQTQQHRLFPYLAGAYVLKVFSTFLSKLQYEKRVENMFKKGRGDPHFGLEMHGISCASKPFSTWFTRDALQECREACAGHGYLKVSQLGDLRNNNDASCTYEGENHILMQQTSNWLIKMWTSILNGNQFNSPMKSLSFLQHAKEILESKFELQNYDELLRPECILKMYAWLTCYLLKISHDKYEAGIKLGKSAFDSKNENQVYYARDMATAYIQHYILCKFLEHINTSDDSAIKRVLNKVFALYGLFRMENHIGHFYEGGYFVGKQPFKMIQDAILELCRSLKDDSVSLVDAIAPDDYILNSPLGYSDGKVYDHLKTAFFQRKDTFDRPDWWKDILHCKPEAKL